MAGYLDHLGLRDWPFTVVPRREYCTFVAGRPELRDDICSLVRALSRRDTSSINVLWSWFGAGKTHSLYYLANQAEKLTKTSPPVPLLTVYTEFPKSARSFVDLYRSFASAVEVNDLLDAFLEVATSPRGNQFHDEVLLREPDLAATLRILAMGKPQDKAVALRWIRGDVVPMPQLRQVGISQKISSTERAIQILTFLIHLFGDAARERGCQGHRVLWLIDEFQRLALASRQVVSDVNTGLHSLFNACPTGLTLIISFSGPPDTKRLPAWFSPELRDRIGATKVMILPPLQPNEAVGFVRDILAHFRSPATKTSASYYPFSKESCQSVVEYLASRTELRPRNIMHAFSAILEAADLEIEKGKMDTISSEFAKKILGEYVIVSDEEENE